jgi:hypothetical protein
MARRQWIPMAALFVLIASVAHGQRSAVTSAQASPFMGTWVIQMTEPAAFRGTHTVRVWEKDGAVAASLQVGKFPATEATGIYRDGDMLVFTISHDANDGKRRANLGRCCTHTGRRFDEGRSNDGTEPNHQARNRQEADAVIR